MDAETQDRIQACRACKAPIVFLVTRKKHRIPVDAATVKAGDHEFDQGAGHVSHFATCPEAGRFRKRRK